MRISDYDRWATQGPPDEDDGAEGEGNDFDATEEDALQAAYDAHNAELQREVDELAARMAEARNAELTLAQEIINDAAMAEWDNEDHL